MKSTILTLPMPSRRKGNEKQLGYEQERMVVYESGRGKTNVVGQDEDKHEDDVADANLTNDIMAKMDEIKLRRMQERLSLEE